MPEFCAETATVLADFVAVYLVFFLHHTHTVIINIMVMTIIRGQSPEQKPQPAQAVRKDTE